MTVTASRRARLLIALALPLIGLAGFGEDSKGHSVTVSWHASPSTHETTVVGYNLYRRTASATTPTTYDRIATKVTGTTYEDHLVQSGTTYYYAVRSVDQRGRESSFSTEITVQVP